jgi:hypothetical protein
MTYKNFTYYIMSHLYHCLFVVAITCKQTDQVIGVVIAVPQAAEVVWLYCKLPVFFPAEETDPLLDNLPKKVFDPQ